MSVELYLTLALIFKHLNFRLVLCIIQLILKEIVIVGENNGALKSTWYPRHLWNFHVSPERLHILLSCMQLTFNCER